MDVIQNEMPIVIDGILEGEFERRVSIQERVRVLPPLHWQGIDIYILDESSQMYTGSFKAFTALTCISDCLRKGIEEICFVSGANTGMALAAYANRLGIGTHFFIPVSNTWKLDTRYVGSPLSSVYAVEDPASTKAICNEFAAKTDIPLMPERDHHLIAGRKRGAIIFSLIRSGLKFDWFAQTVCAGFGPIGIYDFLLSFKEQDPAFEVPKFLGVQQLGNCALVRYLLSRKMEFVAGTVGPSGQLIEEIMYDRHPETYGTFPLVEHVIRASNGAMVTITNNELANSLINTEKKHLVHEHLECYNTRLQTMVRNRGIIEIVQKAGFMAIAGVMEAVRARFITEGQKVLCSFGAGASAGNFQPLPQDHILWIKKPYTLCLQDLVTAVKRGREVR